MHIPFAQFDQWIESVHGGRKKPSLSAVARGAGLSQARVSMQKTRGYADVNVVISYSRFLGLDVVAQLTSFGILDLLEQKVEPTEDELISQVSLVNLLAEVQRRLGADPRPLSDDDEPLRFARWFDAVVPRGRGKELGARIGVKQDEVSRKNAQNAWSVEQLHELCRACGLNFRMSMVAAGRLGWHEVGFDPDRREVALHSVSDSWLFGYVRGSLSFMERQARLLGDTR